MPCADVVRFAGLWMHKYTQEWGIGMERQDKWSRFMATGSVADYLEYRLEAGQQTAQYAAQNASADKAEVQYGSGNHRSDRDGTDRVIG